MICEIYLLRDEAPLHLEGSGFGVGTGNGRRRGRGRDCYRGGRRRCTGKGSGRGTGTGTGRSRVKSRVRVKDRVRGSSRLSVLLRPRLILGLDLGVGLCSGLEAITGPLLGSNPITRLFNTAMAVHTFKGVQHGHGSTYLQRCEGLPESIYSCLHGSMPAR